MADSRLEVLISARDATALAIDEAKQHLEELRFALDETSVTAGEFDAAMVSTSASADVGAGGIDALGLAAAGAALLLSPFIAEVVGATAILGGFAVGLAATLTVISVAGAGLAGLAVGALLLAQATGQVNKPMEQLVGNLQKAATAMGKEALDSAQNLIGFLNDLIAPVAKLGTEALRWLGNVLPDALNMAEQAVGPFLAAVDQMGRILGGFITQALARAPQFAPVLEGMLTVGIGAVQGLLTNLLRLSDWFTARLPAMGPIVGQIMGAIGTALQGVATVAGAVVDFFVSHWSQITAAANFAWNAIETGWKAVQPMLQAELPMAVSVATELFGYLRQHSELVRDVFMAVGAAAAIAAGVLVGVGVAALGILDALTWLYDRFNDVQGAINDATTAAWNFVTALANAANEIRNMPVVGGIMSAAGIPAFPGGGAAPGSSAPAAGGGMGAGGGMLAASQITNHFYIQASDPEAAALEVMARMQTSV